MKRKKYVWPQQLVPSYFQVLYQVQATTTYLKVVNFPPNKLPVLLERLTSVLIEAMIPFQFYTSPRS